MGRFGTIYLLVVHLRVSSLAINQLIQLLHFVTELEGDPTRDPTRLVRDRTNQVTGKVLGRVKGCRGGPGVLSFVLFGRLRRAAASLGPSAGRFGEVGWQWNRKVLYQDPTRGRGLSIEASSSFAGAMIWGTWETGLNVCEPVHKGGRFWGSIQIHNCHKQLWSFAAFVGSSILKAQDSLTVGTCSFFRQT